MKQLEEIIQEMKELKMNEKQMAYAIAKCWYETLHQADEEIEKKVLEENEFYSVCPDIPELNGIRASKSYEFVKDNVKFDEFLKLYYAECEKQGIKWEWNKTIDGEAFEQMKKYEEELLDWFEGSISKFSKIKSQINPESIKMARSHWKYRNQVIDLAMKWNDSFEKYAS